MTSKEALNDLLNMADYCLEEKERKQIKQEYKIILKDLEVLEIIKNKNVDVDVIKNVMKDNRKFECYPYENITQEEFNIIKDWLESE